MFSSVLSSPSSCNKVHQHMCSNSVDVTVEVKELNSSRGDMWSQHLFISIDTDTLTCHDLSCSSSAPLGADQCKSGRLGTRLPDSERLRRNNYIKHYAVLLRS